MLPGGFGGVLHWVKGERVCGARVAVVFLFGVFYWVVAVAMAWACFWFFSVLSPQ